MKEATDILIKEVRTGKLWLAHEATLAVKDPDTKGDQLFFERYEAGIPIVRTDEDFFFAVFPVALKVLEGPTPKTIFMLFDGLLTVPTFERIEVLGRPARELPFTPNDETRRLEAILTATLEGVSPDKATLRPAPASLQMTDQGGVIAITRQGADLLFEDLEVAISELMIYPEELAIARLAVNPERSRPDWLRWGVDNCHRAPVELRAFLRGPDKGSFTIPADAVEKVVEWAKTGPDFIDPKTGPAFFFLPC